LKRFEPEVFKSLARGNAGNPNSSLRHQLRLGERGWVFLFALGIVFLMLLGRGCAYQNHEVIGKSLNAYKTVTFTVTSIDVTPQTKNGPEASYIEGCVLSIGKSFCQERIRGDTIIGTYKVNNEYEALLRAKIGDSFAVLFNEKAPRPSKKGQSLRVIDTNLEAHEANARIAIFVGWAYLIWPIICFMALIWSIPVARR
jgi:hypothetical protein